ncbi:MAG: MMPL family transporter, partial [Bacteroidota bacterium]
MPKLRLSYDFEKFFPQNDAQLDFYYDHRTRFETDNDFVLVAIKPKSGVFNPLFLTQLDSLTRQFKRVPNIENSLSITNYRLPVLTPLGWNTVPAINIRDTAQLPLDSARLINDANVRGNLLSTDGTTATLFLRNDPSVSKKKSDALLHSLDSLIALQHFDEVHVAGKIHGQYHYIKKMGEELLMFSLISVVLLSVFLFITFRTGWGIWVPLLIVAVSMVWLLGFIALIGEEINMLCTILPTIIFVVGIADSVHILEKFIHELRHGHTKLQALVISYRHVGFATLLTALTNAVGFITLLISNIEPIRKFGIFTSVGIMFAFILTYLLLPAALLFLPAPKVAANKHSDTIWSRILPALFSWVMGNRKKILAATLVLCLVSLAGAFRIKINNYLLEDWSDDDPQKMDYVFFETNFSGVRPFEMQIMVTDPAKNVLDSSVIRQVNLLQDYLVNHYGIGAVVSPVSLVKTLNRAAHAGDEQYYSIPSEAADWENISEPLEKLSESGKASAFLSVDLQTARISGRIKDFGGYEFK